MQWETLWCACWFFTSAMQSLHWFTQPLPPLQKSWRKKKLELNIFAPLRSFIPNKFWQTLYTLFGDHLNRQWETLSHQSFLQSKLLFPFSWQLPRYRGGIFYFRPTFLPPRDYTPFSHNQSRKICKPANQAKCKFWATFLLPHLCQIYSQKKRSLSKQISVYFAAHIQAVKLPVNQHTSAFQPCFVNEVITLCEVLRQVLRGRIGGRQAQIHFVLQKITATHIVHSTISVVAWTVPKKKIYADREIRHERLHLWLNWLLLFLSDI